MSELSISVKKQSVFSCLYTLKEVLPGLMAMFFIAIFSNNLMGVPNPFTLENLFAYLDRVIGPVNGQGFFQIMNSNFVWNAFLLGFLIANIFGVHNSWKKGLSYIHLLMPLGIIMLAPHFILSHAFKAGWAIILLAVCILFITATLTMFLGKLFKMDDRLSADVAGALSTGDPHVCAILMPLLKAKGGQVINAAASVILTGAVFSFLFPLIAPHLGLSAEALGLTAVLGIGNGAAAHSAAFGVSYEAGRYAVYYDVVRHVIMPAGFIYVFLYCFIRRMRHKDNPEIHAAQGINKIPPYLLVFIFCWILACLHVFKEPAHHVIFELVRWDFSLAAAALGLSLSIREVAGWGVRGFILAVSSGVIRLLLLVGAISLLNKLGIIIL